MRYARPRKHYRAAENEIKAQALKGTFIAEEDKIRIGFCALGVSFLIFLLGLLTGAVASRD